MQLLFFCCILKAFPKYIFRGFLLTILTPLLFFSTSAYHTKKIPQRGTLGDPLLCSLDIFNSLFKAEHTIKYWRDGWQKAARLIFVTATNER